ncbi:Bug family tripartite tricarboxylate transporter substrate binding protein [Aquabacterium sp.]|uniref:Bug family tripartite tricarboxylate transporter substrate binding protein n=1 Tax=Aquabacterium sp. TaxID=1872578 RepID=UPI003782DB3C
MNITRRPLLIAAAAATLLAASGSALAQAWPTKPIMIVNGYPPGGDSDAMARIYAEKLTARLGQQVLVDNRAGASGTIAASAVAKAAPDGYTLLFVPSTFAIAQHTLKPNGHTAHDVSRDFTPIIKTGNVPLLAVAAPGTAKDLKTLLAEAKAGKGMTYGTPGSGSPMHIVGEMLNKAAGTQIVHVPYRGVAPVINDALGGHINIGWVTPAAASAHIQAGKLVPLAVAERQRSKLMKDVPTLIELGYKDVEVSAWMGLLGPKGLPPELTAKLNALMNEILKMPDVVAKMNALGIEPVGGEPAVLARQIAADDARFGKLVKDFGIQAD